MRIDCPLCRSRPLGEFSYRGDATLAQPPDDSEESIEAWVDHLYFRDNPKGWHRELWQHQAGCRAWLIVERHTLSHQIRSVELAAVAKRGRDD